MAFLGALLVFQFFSPAEGASCNGCDAGDYDERILLQTRTQMAVDTPYANMKKAPPSFGVEEAGQYTKSQILLISSSMLLVSAMLLYIVHVPGSCGNTRTQVHHVLYLLQLISYTNLTLMVLESYDLAVALGRQAAFSGNLIGFYSLGLGIGAVLFWAVDNRFSLGTKYPRGVVISCSMCSLIGCIALCWASLTAQDINRSNTLTEYLQFVILAARVLSGLGCGAIVQFNYSTLVRTTLIEERAEAFLLLFLMIMVGIGLGPVISSLGSMFAGMIRFGMTGIQSTILSLTMLIAVAFYPADVLSYKPEASPQNNENGHFTSSVIVIAGCLFISTLRSFVVSSLEAASALLLEHDYGWHPRVIGLSVGTTFLCTIPLKLAHGVFKDRLTTVGWIRVFACASIVGSMLLHPKVAEVLAPSHRGVMILFVDAVSFSSIYVCDGLSVGIMARHFIKGSIFDSSTVMCVQILLTASLGRTLGCWFARVIIAAGGQNLYALLQIILTSCFLIAFEVSVCPWMKRSPWQQQEATLRSSPVPSLPSFTTLAG